MKKQQGGLTGHLSPSRYQLLAGRDETGDLEEGEVDPSLSDEERECEQEIVEGGSSEEWNKDNAPTINKSLKRNGGGASKVRPKTPRKPFMRAKDIKKFGNGAAIKKVSSQKL